jgi:hypothetical protein
MAEGNTLSRQGSLAIGLATMGVAWAVYGQVCPKVADMRVGRQDDAHAGAAEKTARWTAGGIVVAVSLIAKDATVFIMGASMVVALSWMHRQANHVNGAQGTAVMPSSRATIHDPAVNTGYSPSA